MKRWGVVLAMVVAVACSKEKQENTMSTPGGGAAMSADTSRMSDTMRMKSDTTMARDTAMGRDTSKASMTGRTRRDSTRRRRR